MSLLTDETLTFHPLTVLREGDEVVVGRPDIDSYGVFPDDGAALLDELRAGRTLGQASEWYRTTYGEAPEMDDFVATLRDLRFLRDGQDTVTHPDVVVPVRFQRLGRALFSPLAWVAFALLVAAALGICIADTAYAPQQGNVFFSRYLAVIEVTVIVGQIPLILVHELFHLLAGRRLGLRSSIRLGHRLHFLVFETVLDGLVSVPRRQRYLPMLAGTLADVLVMSALTVTAFITGGLVGGVCLALAFTTLPRILWQLYFFLRTDLYYLIVTVLGCVDLHTTARQVIANRVNRFLGRHDRLHDEAMWHPRDRRAARWYAPLMVVGYVVALGTTALVVLPLAWHFFGDAIGRAFLGADRSTADVLDLAALLLLNAGQPVAAALVARRDRIQKETLS